MKQVIIGLACALIASVGFAQTGITSKQSTTVTEPRTTTQTTTTTYESGTVTTYEPGKSIVVKDEREGPVSFALHAPVRVVNKAGHVVSRALTPKDRVKVYYNGTGDSRTVDYVEVED